jgi:D-alanyl-lipoteichoic acid acyltransferase DltB (MBOAT superfamily)
MSIVSNLLLLIVFKYFDFLNGTLRNISDYFNIFYGVPDLNLLLPVGISFYTFQSLSYIIDVYRGDKEPERHIGIYALYVSFFPQLVAGPIERSTRLLPQFYKKHEFNYQRAISGLRLICWGFFKKLVIADRLAVIVDNIYSAPHNYSGVPLIIAAFCFSYQVYCDFSGYSDIAIGSARVMGFDLMENFKRPFSSKSTAELWRRWHISLFSWFKDYVYVPLGGNRVGKQRRYFNLMVVFLISGLWHGAAWTFVIFGGLQGVILIFSEVTQRIRSSIGKFLKLDKAPKIHNFIKVLITFSLFNLSLIVFRSENMKDALYITTHLHVGLIDFLLNLTNVGYVRSVIGLLGVVQREIVTAFLAIVILEIVQFLHKDDGPIVNFDKQPMFLRWSEYYLLVGGIIFFGAFNATQGFIYFQF